MKLTKHESLFFIKWFSHKALIKFKYLIDHIIEVQLLAKNVFYSYLT